MQTLSGPPAEPSFRVVQIAVLTGVHSAASCSLSLGTDVLAKMLNLGLHLTRAPSSWGDETFQHHLVT